MLATREEQKRQSQEMTQDESSRRHLVLSLEKREGGRKKDGERKRGIGGKQSGCW